MIGWHGIAPHQAGLARIGRVGDLQLKGLIPNLHLGGRQPAVGRAIEAPRKLVEGKENNCPGGDDALKNNSL